MICPARSEAPFPGFIAPALATPVLRNVALKSVAVAHRAVQSGCTRSNTTATDFSATFTAACVFSRRGHDWSDRLGHLVTALRPLDSHALVLDGEVIVPTPGGRSDFHALEKALSRGEQRRGAIEANNTRMIFILGYRPSGSATFRNRGCSVD